MDETLPVCIEPFLVDLKWKQMVGIRVRHLFSLFFAFWIVKVGVDLCKQPTCRHHRRMPTLIPMLHQ